MVTKNSDNKEIVDKTFNGTRFPSALIGIGVDIPKGFEGRILLIQQKRCRREVF